MSIATNSAIQAQTQAVNTPISTGGAGAGQGGLLANQKDAKEASTDAKFGEIWNQIQAKYGAKPEKPREIKKTLGKDDFLRIMITQMKNQDPTQPFKADQMAQQMAQYTSVEQLQNVNQNIKALAGQNQPLERMAMTGMIGKVITVDRERFPHIEGQNDSLSFALPKDAAEAKVTIISETGETVLQKDLGKLKAGENNFTWDGVKSNTLPAKGGNYLFHVEAKDPEGRTIQTQSKSQAKIIGVSFEGTDPVFLIGDAAHQEKVTMRNIVKIEADPASLGAVPGAVQMGAPAAAPHSGITSAGPKQNFFTFTKGQGSSNIDPSRLPPEAREALAKFQQQAAEMAKEGTQSQGAQKPQVSAAQPQAQSRQDFARQAIAEAGRQQQGGGEKGFPNGLHDQ